MWCEVKMSLRVAEGIGFSIFLFVWVHVCVYVLFKCGLGMESFCPHISLESLIRPWPETQKPKDMMTAWCKRLTAPQADFVMQFSVAGWPNTSWANSSTCCFLTKQTQTRSQTCFCAMLFVWNWGGNLCIIWLWFISVENCKWVEGVFSEPHTGSICSTRLAIKYHTLQ